MRAPWAASTPKPYEPQENVHNWALVHTGMTPLGETSYVTSPSTSPASDVVCEPLASAGEGSVEAQAPIEPTKAIKTTCFTGKPYHQVDLS